MKAILIKRYDILIRVSGLSAFLVLWEAAPRIGWADAQFLPPLSVVLSAVYQLWADGSLPIHLLVSLWRALLGLLLAAMMALPLGFILEGWLPETAKRLDSLFRLLSQVNPFSLAPVFILFFGIGEREKLAIITLVALWPILFHTITGIRTVDPALIKTARSLNISKIGLLSRVILPGALPTIITGIRIGTQMAVFMLIGAEMMGASAGLGWLVHNSAMMYQIPRLYAGGMFIILLGILINQLILRVEKASFFWQDSVSILDQDSGVKDPNRVNRLYVPLTAGVIAAILFFGGREVSLVNTQGLHMLHSAHHMVDSNMTMGEGQMHHP